MPYQPYNTGWNIVRKDHQNVLTHMLHKHNPEILWISLPHLTGRTFTKKEDDFIAFLRTTAEWQLHKKRHVFFEGLASLPVWNHRHMLGLKLSGKLQETTFPWCGHGVVTGSASGM